MLGRDFNPVANSQKPTITWEVSDDDSDGGGGKEELAGTIAQR
jgi:hypothetical protein